MGIATSSPLGLQQQQRRYAIYKDQHGRVWGAVIDKRTGHPVDTMAPKFEAPWFPNAKYVQILPDSAFRPNDVVINYDEAVAELEKAHRDYQHAMMTTGIELHGQAFDETKPTLAVLSRVGKPPKNPEPYRLAAEGNGFLLGTEQFDSTNPAHVAAARAIERFDLLPKAETKKGR